MASAVGRARGRLRATGSELQRRHKVLTLQNMNQNVVKLQYAVRGPLLARAADIEKELEQGMSKPFKRVIRANLGDAHAMGQKPITFVRQVVACATLPELIRIGGYPDDVCERAQQILNECGGKSVGAYSGSYGIDLIRRHVAEYIARRDGHPSDFNNVVLCGGASLGIKACFALFCNENKAKISGVMVPIPQYPLYSATLVEYGMELVGYYLDEDKGWGLDAEELERSYQEGQKTSNVQALVVINPGNPTGQVLSRDNIESVIKFAQKKNLFIFADEVYQDNVYGSNKFYSFKKVMTEMGPPYKDMELASFNTVSKGYVGECGMRGGWMELVNMHPDVQANLYKSLSAVLCPTVLGQIVVDCVAKPPAKGEDSYEKWHAEKNGVLQSLARRAAMIVDTFNKMPGFKCNVVQGAMYAFPQVQMPPKALAAAKQANQTPDIFYAFQLLEETGICVVPGCGFKQKPGTYHFRTTILPQPELLQEMLDIFQRFHIKFTKQFS